MKVITGKRQTGKTSQIVKFAAENGYTIVSPTKQSIVNAMAIADELGYDIPFPITFDQFYRQEWKGGMRIKGFVIDDVDQFLSKLIGNIDLIKGISVTTNGENENAE